MSSRRQAEVLRLAEGSRARIPQRLWPVAQWCANRKLVQLLFQHRKPGSVVLRAKLTTRGRIALRDLGEA